MDAVFPTPLARLRFFGALEGASFLLLLFVAMPLKYLAGQPQMVSVMGSAHGLLFLLFVASVAEVSLKMRWPVRRTLGALAAAVLPFGPFVFDAHLRRETAAQA